VEKQIEDLEARLSVLAAQLENPPADPARVQKIGREYVKVQGELEDLMRAWESLQKETTPP